MRRTRRSAESPSPPGLWTSAGTGWRRSPASKRRAGPTRSCGPGGTPPRVLREDRNRLLHAGIDFEVDFEIEDGMVEPFAFPVLIDDGRGCTDRGSQSISVATWDELAEQLWSSAAQGEVLICQFRSLALDQPPG
jgi:hypothetical protein